LLPPGTPGNLLASRANMCPLTAKKQQESSRGDCNYKPDSEPRERGEVCEQ